jgi:hypothetical protein
MMVDIKSKDRPAFDRFDIKNNAIFTSEKDRSILSNVP